MANGDTSDNSSPPPPHSIIRGDDPGEEAQRTAAAGLNKVPTSLKVWVDPAAGFHLVWQRRPVAVFTVLGFGGRFRGSACHLLASRADSAGAAATGEVRIPSYMNRKNVSSERIKSIRESNGSFDSCNSQKQLVYINSTSQNFRLIPVSIYPFKTYVICCSCSRGGYPVGHLPSAAASGPAWDAPHCPPTLPAPRAAAAQHSSSPFSRGAPAAPADNLWTAAGPCSAAAAAARRSV